ncbi:ESCRT-0 subunit protein hse1 [Mortierella sp. NVP85]|nr:ESCRT-0 subunit protein hse1 [Mortierella sp. NVP85]
MPCLSISEHGIEIALGHTKDAFCNSTVVADEPANLEQCVKALKITVDRLTKIKKYGKRALNNDQNLKLKEAVEEAYMELTQLQAYFGPDKAQSRKSVDTASISSGGTHSIPDQFYQADEASISGGIDILEEENSVGNTPISNKVDLDVFHIDEPNEDQAKPREQYVKHAGCFADAAPRMEHSTEGMDEGLLGTTSTSVEANPVDPVRDDILNPETSEAPSVAPPQETSTPPSSENNNEISETRKFQVIGRVQALYDFVGDDEDDLSIKIGDIINVIEFVNDYWWRGVLGKNVGIFPCAYVQLL